MNQFDWLDFLDRYGVEYVVSGPNVARNHVNVRCPFCGAGDISHHMGISLVGPWWGCWRDPEHRGKSAARLVQALLSCSWSQANDIAGARANVPGDLLGSVEALLNPQEERGMALRSLQMPEEFLPITDRPAARLFCAYLSKRGYTDRQISSMTEKYGVRYCKKGPFRGRIIFPVFYEGKLVTWTGRSIYPGEELRYKTLTTDADRASVLGVEPAAGNINEFVLWFDELMEDHHEAVVIVEGPFDALRVRTLGEKFGITSTCFFTSAPSKTQTALLYILLQKYKKRILLLDSEGTVGKAMRIEQSFGDSMTGAGLDVLHLPVGIKDPGDLTQREFNRLFRTRGT